MLFIFIEAMKSIWRTVKSLVTIEINLNKGVYNTKQGPHQIKSYQRKKYLPNSKQISLFILL